MYIYGNNHNIYPQLTNPIPGSSLSEFIKIQHKKITNSGVIRSTLSAVQ